MLLTYNAPVFCRLHARFIDEGRHHAGIIIAEQQRHSIGEMMRSVLHLTGTLDAEAMKDRVEFFNRWV